jgi:hypothetical protein
MTPIPVSALVITSPGFGSSSVNSGFIRVSLVQPNERKILKRNCRINQMDQTISDAKPP